MPFYPLNTHTHTICWCSAANMDRHLSGTVWYTCSAVSGALWCSMESAKLGGAMGSVQLAYIGLNTTWVSGKFYSKPLMPWEKPWFPVDFPFNQASDFNSTTPKILWLGKICFWSEWQDSLLPYAKMIHARRIGCQQKSPDIRKTMGQSTSEGMDSTHTIAWWNSKHGNTVKTNRKPARGSNMFT